MKQQRTPLPPLPINPTLPPKPDFASFSFGGGIARQSKPSKLLSRMEQASLQIASAAILDSAGPISRPDTASAPVVPPTRSFLEPSSSAPLLVHDAIAPIFDEAMDLALSQGKKTVQEVSLPDATTPQELPNGYSLDNWIRNTTLLGSDDIELHVKQVTNEWAQVVRAPLQRPFTPALPTSEATFSSPLKQEPARPPSIVKPPVPASSSLSEILLSNQTSVQSAGPTEPAASQPSLQIKDQDTPMPDEAPQSSIPVDSCQLQAIPRPQTPEESSNSTAETPMQTVQDDPSLGENASNQATSTLQLPVLTRSTLNVQHKPNKGVLSVETGRVKYNTHRDPSHEPSPPSASSATTQRAPVVNGNRGQTPPPIPPQSQGRASRGYQSYRRSVSPLPRTSRPFIRGQAFSPSRPPVRLRSSSPAPRGTHRSRYTSPRPRSPSPPYYRTRESPPHLYRARPVSTFRRPSPPIRRSPPPNRNPDYSRESYYSLPPSRDYRYASSHYTEAPLANHPYERPRSPARNSTIERSGRSAGHPEQMTVDFHSRNQDIRDANHDLSHDVRMASYNRPTTAIRSVSYKRSRDDEDSAPQSNHATPAPKRQKTEQAIPDETISTISTGQASRVVGSVRSESGVVADVQPNQTTNKSQPHSRSISPQNSTSERKGKLWSMFAGGLTKPPEDVEPSAPTTAGPSTRHSDTHTETAPPLQQRIQAISQEPAAQIPKAGLAERLGGVQSTDTGVQSRPPSNSSLLSRRINVNQQSPGPVPPIRKRADSRQETLAQRMSLEQPSGSHTLMSRLDSS